MSKSINKVQSDILLNRMQNNRPIACSFVKLPKDVVAEFWNSLVEELNSAGPPIKGVFEWKKVWIDQKRYVRSKAAANLKSQRGTGGGPNQTKSLSVSEQCIYELIGMKESVEGLENCLSFGLPKDIFEGDKSEAATISHEINEVPSCSTLLTPPSSDATKNEEFSDKKALPTKRRRIDSHEKFTTAQLIAEELKSQENLCSKIVELSESLQKHNKEIENMMKRVYRALEKNNDLKSENIKELQRHNLVIENLRKKEVANKVEKNTKLIEIEEMKLQLLQKNK